MHEPVKFHFDVDGENFSSAGEASVMVKKKLRQLGFPPDGIYAYAPILQQMGGDEILLGGEIVIHSSYTHTAAACYGTNGHGAIACFFDLALGFGNQTVL